MSKFLRFLSAVAVALAAGSAVQASALIVVERRFPTNFYCPIDNDDFDLTFVAEGPFARLTFTGNNRGPTAQWLHRRLDNIGIEAKSIYDANKLVSPGYDICYVAPGHANTPGYNFSAAGTPEIYLNLFDTNADGWDLNRGAYFDPGPGVSAIRNPPVANDVSGGALAMGRETVGQVSVTTSVLISGLTTGVNYILTGWWNLDNELSPMTVLIDTLPCIDRDADGVVDCSDCDDRNPKRKPGGTEVCDGIDNDCDGLIDESTPCDRVCDVPQLVGGSNLRVTTAVFASDNPSIAWNGTDFGMFYKDSRNGGQEIFYSRVSTAGVKVGADVNLTPGGGSNSKPRAVWTGSEYGVVWEENGFVAFRRFDRNGAAIGSEVLLGAASPGAFAPDIAWTGQEYGLVWSQYVVTPEIFFTRLAPEATALMTPVQISAGQNPQDPKVSWNGTNYGVVWQGFGSTQTIYFRRVVPLNVATGTILELTPAGAGSFQPAIAAGGTDWGVAWADYRNGSDSEIYFARVSAAGAKLGTDTRVTNATGGSVFPALAWSGSEWGVTNEDFRSGDSEQWFGRVTLAGVKTGTDFRVTNAAGTSQQASIVWAGGRYALSWSDDRNAGEQEIYFSRVGCDCVDADADTFSSCVDCDDGRAATFPGATQICDGFNNNCSDVNWPLLTGTSEADADGDGFTGCTGDCSDANSTVWATPGEARFLLLSHNKLTSTTSLSWSAPTAPGGTSPFYDTVRSNTASNFVTGATCVETNNGPNTVSTDTGTPAPVFFYLIRCENACPSGQGTLGNASNGTPRTARTCP
jgi:hypothetical protein